MPDLLLELLSEEIPARMQSKAADDLRKLVTDSLVEAGLIYEGAKAFATPRRLALTVHGLPAASPDSREERRGPRVGAPDKAIEGFLKAAGLTSVDQATVQSDKKGEFYLAVVEKPGRPATEVIAEIVPAIIRSFPWPKSMRWGEGSGKPGSLNWVRPLQSILCTFGPETEEPEVVAFDVDGIRSGSTTFGHRFMAPEQITVRRFDDYAKKLEAAKVVLDAERRKDIILHDARDQALALGVELVEDDGLADEVSGLVEWPVVLTGTFDTSFLDLPSEVIRTTIRNNQKCFVLAKPGESRLANRFIMVANIEANDGGKEIIAGNERVIRARLADAQHFWNTDLAPLADYRDRADKPLDQRLEKLKAQNIIFHEKLGTQGERVERIARLAREIAPLLGADPDKAERAAQLAKADLVTEMVGEFPELQGLMGKYYAVAQGEDASVATAIEDHYKPAGPSDRVPTDPVAIAVALADKLDILVGFWAIDEKPTGSKDPYALRRAALGVIRIVLENGLSASLNGMILQSRKILKEKRAAAVLSIEYTHDRVPYFQTGGSLSVVMPRGFVSLCAAHELPSVDEIVNNALNSIPVESDIYFDPIGYIELESGVICEVNEQIALTDAMHPDVAGIPSLPDLLVFFADRLKVQLREQGARHDLVDAVFALGGQDDLLLIVRRVDALGKFLDTDDGKNLLAGYKRAVNILRDEEKKFDEKFDGAVDESLLSEPEEKALAAAVNVAIPATSKAVEDEDFAAAMSALAGLRVPVDSFFDKVLVNAPDEKIRSNRLRLLDSIRQATGAVADFSKVGG